MANSSFKAARPSISSCFRVTAFVDAIFSSTFANISSIVCTAFDFFNAGAIVCLNNLSAARTHCTHTDFSVHCTQYLRAVSARVIGIVPFFAVACIIACASSTFGRIAVLYKASPALFTPLPKSFAVCATTGVDQPIIAPVFIAERGSCPLASQKPNHSLVPAVVPHNTLWLILPVTPCPVSHWSREEPYFAVLGAFATILVPKFIAGVVFDNAPSHLPTRPAHTLHAAIFHTVLPNQKPNHSVFLPCSLCCSFVLSNSL